MEEKNIENLEETQVAEKVEVQEDKKPKKKKKKVGKIIVDILITIVFLIVVFEAVIGMINMQRINEEKEPVWYINKNTETNNLKQETTYNLGLYKIVKTDTAKKTTITLKPFFY